MALPRIKGSGGGMLDGLKSKLGFADAGSHDDYDDEGYYDDYGQEGYDDYDDYGQDAGDYAPRSERGSSRSSSGSGPHLVSIDDVRANTQIPDSLNRDPLPPRRSSGSSQQQTAVASGYRPYTSSGRAIEHAADYMRSTETSDITTVPAAPRSSGYNSLFSSSAGSSSASSAPASSTAGSRSYDPYETYAGSGVSSHNPSRALTVLKPVSYGEVERIAKTLKAGDIVVLSLRNTPDHLAKRILDFSFGVSSALDASVECIADKVFAIIRGRALTEEELVGLRNQGVL